MNLLDKCAECGALDFYNGPHVKDCSREANLDTCGACDEFYLNTSVHVCPIKGEK